MSEEEGKFISDQSENTIKSKIINEVKNSQSILSCRSSPKVYNLPKESKLTHNSKNLTSVRSSLLCISNYAKSTAATKNAFIKDLNLTKSTDVSKSLINIDSLKATSRRSREYRKIEKQ